ncbi:hypothetical protein G7046_g2861 [Stylonectria norvegica]|nr:hypothetical protein G7046_g2861 [Stylonectria norvegica]
MTIPPTIYNLPNELITHILSFLDSPSFIAERLREDPAKIYQPPHTACETPIKDASLVCHLWRRSILPLLFRHALWSFQRFCKPAGDDVASQIEILAFLHRNGISQHVESFTIIIDPPRETGGTRYADGQFWGLLPMESRPPHPPPPTNLLWSVFSGEAQRIDRSHVNRDEITVDSSLQRNWDNNWLWHSIFGQLNLLRVTLVSSADILASMLSRSIDLTSDWAFNTHFHILSLSRATRSPTSAGAPMLQTTHLPSRNPTGLDYPSDLFSICDWTSLLINEGSSIPVYATYEFFHYSPPSLLRAILNSSDASFSHLVQNNLQSFYYIAIFPLSHHIADFLIANCPPVEHLFVQLVPKDLDFKKDNFLSRIDISDLWLERNTAYSLLMRQIFAPEPNKAWPKLRVFESGDAADVEAWDLAVQYVEASGLEGWKVESEGVIVRDEGTKTKPIGDLW